MHQTPLNSLGTMQNEQEKLISFAHPKQFWVPQKTSGFGQKYSKCCPLWRMGG